MTQTTLTTSSTALAVPEQKLARWLPGGWYVTGWVPPIGLSEDEYHDMGPVLEIAARGLPWWWGDYILFGECRYGETYAQAVDLSGLQYTTLAHYVNVCRQIEFCRRRQKLTFSHHAAVARDYLTTLQQDRLLRAAERLVWTVRQLEVMRNRVKKVNEHRAMQAAIAEMIENGELVDVCGIPGADAAAAVLAGDNGRKSDVRLNWIDDSAESDCEARGGGFLWCPHCGGRVDF